MDAIKILVIEDDADIRERAGYCSRVKDSLWKKQKMERQGC